MSWSIVANIASIATLILFIIYFIGRIWYMCQVKKETYELISRNELDDFKIVEEFDIGDCTKECFYLTGTETLKSVKVYSCDYNCHKDKIVVGDLYLDCGSLRNSFTFKFNTFLSEGLPKYKIKYVTDDYMIGEFYFCDNAKNGIVDEYIRKKITFKSVLYYLFK